MEKDIKHIEAEMGLTLPRLYRTTLANHPCPDTEAAKLAFLSDPEKIIEQNTDLRRDGFYGNDWPPNLIAIGHDGGGCVFFIHAEDPECHIYYADFDEDFPPSQPICDFQRFLSRLNHPDGFEHDEGGFRSFLHELDDLA